MSTGADQKSVGFDVFSIGAEENSSGVDAQRLQSRSKKYQAISWSLDAAPKMFGVGILILEADENSYGGDAQSLEADRKNLGPGIGEIGCRDKRLAGNMLNIAADPKQQLT